MRRGLRPQARFGAQPGRKARLLARRSRPRPTNRGKQPANREPPREAGGHGRHVCRPYNARHTPYKPGDGRRGGVLRAACMPPLRIDQTRSRAKKRCCGAGCGGRERPPYRARGTRSQPKNVVAGRAGTGRIHAAPTVQGEQQTERKRVAAALYPTANPNFERPQAAVLHNFSFLIFHFSFYCTTPRQVFPLPAAPFCGMV